MTASLSDRWSAWWEDHVREQSASHNSQPRSSLPLSVVDRAVRKDLTHEGLTFPSRRLLEQRLAHDLEPLERGQFYKKSGTEVTLMNLLNLVWLPLIEHINDLSEG